ncbi:glycosyltransferase [Oscillospiraceae bacterium OttesenSCG-928-F05]|nr:glycosyltransferase [Oscillospiraceae bacterium OttesenSCG-928-F05]
MTRCSNLVSCRILRVMMEKIKVLQFPVRNDGDGLTQYVLNNWRHIDRERFQFDFATMDSHLDFEDAVVSSGGKVHYIKSYAEDSRNTFDEDFASILEGNRYHAVHLHTSYWKNFNCEIVAKEKGVPVVIVHAHNTSVGKTRNMSRDEAIRWHDRQRLAFPSDLATHFCACSQSAADWLYGPQIPREKIYIMPNAIDVEAYSFKQEARRRLRKAYALDQHFVIGHVGRFEYQKNHDFLIDVFADVSRAIDTAKLVLIGVGALMETVKAKVDKLGLTDRVLFLGKRDDVEEWYQAMDLFALPSKFEGLGLVLVEAQCAGLKCIASSAVPGEAKITDLLVYAETHKALWTDEMIKVYQNGYRRYDRSHDVAHTGYSIKDQVKALEKMYAGEAPLHE